jgi:flagellar assembly protein FliH
VTGRRATGGPALLLWQFPDLEPSSTPSQTPTFAEVDGDGSAAAIEQGDPSDDNRLVSEIVQEQIANGYNEGFERGLVEGREKGYEAGFAAGSKAAEESLAAQAQRLEAMVTRLGSPIPALEGPVEDAVAALALEVARCVIGNETSFSREYLVRLIRQAIAKVPIEMGALKVLLNPEDLELVRALAPEIENGIASLVADATVEAGDCLVVADGPGTPIKDMRWRPRAVEGISQVDLSLAARWRSVMLALFEGEDK